MRSTRVGQVMMVPLTAADLDRMAELVETYGDFPLGLVDAPVIAVAERLKRMRSPPWIIVTFR